MAPLMHVLHSVSATAAGFLLASVWQGLVLAGCVAPLLRFLPGLTAAVRAMIWMAVLLLVITLPALAMVWRGGEVAATPHAGWLHASDAWSMALLMLWLALACLRVAQLAGSALRLQRFARGAVPVTPSPAIAALLRRSGRGVELCTSDRMLRPSVVGFFRPRILLSPDLLAKLSEAELRHVVLHEIEHLRRYDDWTNLLQKLSIALLPLHPVLLWIDGRMSVEREMACDDGVLRQTRARKAYAACLARLAEDSMVRRGFSLALGIIGSRARGSEFAGRVHRILRAPETRMNRGPAWATAALLLLTVSAGGLELSRSPELVSFTPVRSAAFATMASRPAMTPIRTAEVSYGAPHATLAKATMSGGRLASVVPATVRTSRRHAASDRSIVERSRTMLDPYVTMTVYRTPSGRGRLRAASAPVSQFLYAALPTGDGWLIIQL